MSDMEMTVDPELYSTMVLVSGFTAFCNMFNAVNYVGFVHIGLFLGSHVNVPGSDLTLLAGKVLIILA